MSPCVLGEVVAAHKPSVTHRTDKLLLTRVCSPMPGELVGSSKFLIASFPVAAKRFLSWKTEDLLDDLLNLDIRTLHYIVLYMLNIIYLCGF